MDASFFLTSILQLPITSNIQHLQIKLSNKDNQNQLRMQANGVNYYKGVLLCSRPNESPSIQSPKPFCGRVTPHENIGLVPTKKFDQPQIRKRHLPVLDNHKKWLQGFKKKVIDQKKNEQQEKQKQHLKLQKIKQQGKKQREHFKESQSDSGIFQQTSVPIEPLPAADLEKEKSTRMKKGKKPAWAKTDEQIQIQKQQQMDDLINFFDTAEVKDYTEDQEVKKMLRELKERIQSMKSQETSTDGNWKKKQVARIEEAKKFQDNKKDDILSRISRDSGAQSVASQKTAQRVQQIQKKKGQKEWDKHTTSQKKTQASLDDQIAKNVADEVLRNYPTLKHHSNQSIRKLLERQAHQQIKS